MNDEQFRKLLEILLAHFYILRSLQFFYMQNQFLNASVAFTSALSIVESNLGVKKGQLTKIKWTSLSDARSIANPQYCIGEAFAYNIAQDTPGVRPRTDESVANCVANTFLTSCYLAMATHIMLCIVTPLTKAIKPISHKQPYTQRNRFLAHHHGKVMSNFDIQ